VANGAALPVTVIGGYLGAGKTTLVNQLLRQAGGRRLAVLVNDFGELAIDADLIEAEDGEVLSLAGGCICCSFGSDLMAALMKLPARRPPPDHVLIEASGVALPGSVAASIGLLAGFSLDGVIVVADSETVRARAADRYLADTIERQLDAADLIVLNKSDLADAATLESLRGWLATKAPRARVIEAARAQVPLELVLGVRFERSTAPLRAQLVSGRIALPAEARYERIELRVDQLVDAGALAAALTDPALGVLRAKGLLRDREGSWVVLQLVGARPEVSPTAASLAGSGRLVCIGLRGRLDCASIRAAVDRAADAGSRLKEC